MKIMLDAGHGYSTAGKRSPDWMREYEFNRDVVNYAKLGVQLLSAVHEIHLQNTLIESEDHFLIALMQQHVQ